jgi:hypothetical protein
MSENCADDATSPECADGTDVALIDSSNCGADVVPVGFGTDPCAGEDPNVCTTGDPCPDGQTCCLTEVTPKAASRTEGVGLAPPPPARADDITLGQRFIWATLDSRDVTTNLKGKFAGVSGDYTISGQKVTTENGITIELQAPMGQQIWAGQGMLNPNVSFKAKRYMKLARNTTLVRIALAGELNASYGPLELGLAWGANVTRERVFGMETEAAYRDDTFRNVAMEINRPNPTGADLVEFVRQQLNIPEVTNSLSMTFDSGLQTLGVYLAEQVNSPTVSCQVGPDGANGMGNGMTTAVCRISWCRYRTRTERHGYSWGNNGTSYSSSSSAFFWRAPEDRDIFLNYSGNASQGTRTSMEVWGCTWEEVRQNPSPTIISGSNRVSSTMFNTREWNGSTWAPIFRSY